MLSKLNGRQKTLILVLIISIFSFIGTYLYSGMEASLILGGLIVLILFISKGVWLPDNYGKTYIRKRVQF